MLMVHSFIRPTARARTAIAAVSIAVACGAGAVAPGAALAVPEHPAAAAPTAKVAATTYVTLGRLGIRVSGARLANRTLRVTVSARRRSELRFVIRRGTTRLGSATRIVAPGKRRLKVLLSKPSPSLGRRLRLRVTARIVGARDRPRPGLGIIPVTIPAASPVVVNSAPSGLALSGASVPENAAGGTVVGTLSGTDVDAGDPLSFALVTGVGDADNVSFSVSGGTLSTVAPLDFEGGATRAVRLRVSDGRGGTFEQAFTIAVTDVNEAPSVIGITSATVPENQATGTPVGSLFADDPDLGDTHAFALVDGDGGTDNGEIAIVGDELRAGAEFDLETKASYYVRVRVSDAGGLAAEQALTITVTNINESPTALALSNNSVPENRQAGEIVGALSVADPDAGDTVVFSLVDGDGSTDNALFTIDGSSLRTAVLLDFEEQPTRSVRIAASDGEGSVIEGSFTLTVTDGNEPPVLTLSAGSLAYTEGAAAVVVDGGLTVADFDDTALTGATVRISVGFQAGDELLFTPQLGITRSYNAATGVLTLSGSASLSDYRTALRSITYRSTSDNPGAKAIEFVVKDGDDTSAAVARSLAVTGVNDAPTLDTSDAALAYPENALPLAADAGVVVTDPDSQIKAATVQVTTGFVAAQDELAFANQLGITGAYDDTTGKLTLSGTAAVASYQAALRAVTYENISDNPAPPARELTFVVTDAKGAVSAAATRAIAIGATNDAATIATTAAVLPYTEGAATTAVDPALSVTDPDDPNIEGARVRISGGFQAADELLFTGQFGIIGNYAGGTGELTLIGTSSLANYQAALRSIQFRHNGENPGTSKTIEFRADDGNGLGPASTRTIAVTPVNDSPLVTTTEANLAYTENVGAVQIDAGLGVADPDSAQLTGATVRISANFVAAQDTLAFAGQPGISGAYNGTTGVLNLTGSASVAAYRTALRTVTFTYDGEDTSPPARTITFRATDNLGAASNIASRVVAISSANDVPVANDDTGATDKNTPLAVSAPGLLGNDTDADPGDAISVVDLNGSGTLTGDSGKGAAVTISADGSYTYDPRSSIILTGLSAGESDIDSFTYTAQDSQGAQSTATVYITVTGL